MECKTIKCELRSDYHGFSRPHVGISFTSKPVGNLSALVDTGASVSIFPEELIKGRCLELLDMRGIVHVAGWRCEYELARVRVTVFDKDDDALNLDVVTQMITQKTPLDKQVSELPLILGCESLLPPPNTLDHSNWLLFGVYNGKTGAVLSFYRVL